MVEGKIISANPLRSNVWHYMIQTVKGAVDKYTYFSKDPAGLDTSRHISFEYEVRFDPRYGNSNIIKGDSVKYGDLITDPKSISEFLMKQLKVKKAHALDLIGTYGDKTLKHIFDDPNIVSNLDSNYAETVNKYKNTHAKCEFEIDLTGLGISTQHHDRISNAFKDITDVRDNIYQLYFRAGVPFPKCDEVGLKLGYDYHHEDRLAAFIDHHYDIWNNQGTLYVTKAEIESKCRFAKIKPNILLPLLKKIVWEDEPYYTSNKFHSMEIAVEDFCKELMANGNSIDHTIELTDYQAIAVRNALMYNISIITGGPGRGKSYTIGTIVEKLHTWFKIYVLAPTGAAVERLRCESRINLADGSVAIKTIHSFIHNNVEHKPVTEKKEEPKYAKETGEETLKDIHDMFKEIVIIIDEMSMVDLELFYDFIQLLCPYKKKIRLVLLGDVDQLPSIKGGNLLYDLIHSEAIPYTRLFKNHRTENPELNENAEYANKGWPLDPKDNFIWLEANTPAEIKKTLLETLSTYEIHFENSCILVPQRKSGVCANSLNPILQDYYNPKDARAKEVFRAGDKVIQGTNNKDKDIYNGSIMIVNKVKYVHRGEFVRTEKMICHYYQNECDIGTGQFREIYFHRTDRMPTTNPNTVEYNKIDLAYAMTVHKAQGKGYKAVVIVMHSNMRYMLNRKLLYTAITRAKELCIIISDEAALFECQKEAPKRVTNLFVERQKPNDIIRGFSTITDHLSLIGESCILEDLGVTLDDVISRKPNTITKIHNKLLMDIDMYHMIRWTC